MKIWFNYGSEHSMNLVLIGRFKSNTDAKAFAQDVEDLKEYLKKNSYSVINVKSFDSPIREYLVKNEISFLSPEQLEQILSYETLKSEGNEIKMTSDEFLDGLVAWMIMRGAKAEIFSLHDFPEEK